jgi:hypothetical protein
VTAGRTAAATAAAAAAAEMCLLYVNVSRGRDVGI